MKTVFQKRPLKGFLFNVILPLTILRVNTAQEQSCLPPVTTTITSDHISKYNVSDTSAANKATICYRIIAQDADDQKAVSRVITIQNILTEEELNISPVPATSYSAITLSSASDIKLDITLFDVAGNAVLSRQYPLKKGMNELLLTNLETLPAGLYFVKAFDGASHRNGKLIIHRTL